jgi:hypothetical protein
MQCKDIPDRPILEFLARQDCPATWGEGYFMSTVRDAMPPGTPDRLQRAKMARLIRRGLVGGCDCGCRGDYEITEKGRDWLAWALEG